jgi:hypothetical protein
VRRSITDMAIGIEYDGAWQYGAVVLTMIEYDFWRERAAVMVWYQRGCRLGLGACGSVCVSSCDMMDMVGRLGEVFSACTLAGAAAVSTLGGMTVGAADVGTLGGSLFCVGTLAGIAGVVVAGGVLIRWNIAASFVMAAIVSVETLWKGTGDGGFCRIFVRSIAVMMMWSVWVSAGIMHFVGGVILCLISSHVLCMLHILYNIDNVPLLGLYTILLCRGRLTLHVVWLFRVLRCAFLVVLRGWCCSQVVQRLGRMSKAFCSVSSCAGG